MIPESWLAGFARMKVQAVGNRARTGQSGFAVAFSNHQRGVTRNGQMGGESVPVMPLPVNFNVGSVIVSPFNPLGLAISGTLAPTATEVAADPDRWKGTSFDPALRIVP